MLTNLSVVNILQYIHVSLHCIITLYILNFHKIQLYINTAGGGEMTKYQLMDSCQNISHQAQQR